MPFFLTEGLHVSAMQLEPKHQDRRVCGRCKHQLRSTKERATSFPFCNTNSIRGIEHTTAHTDPSS